MVAGDVHADFLVDLVPARLIHKVNIRRGQRIIFWNLEIAVVQSALVGTPLGALYCEVPFEEVAFDRLHVEVLETLRVVLFFLEQSALSYTLHI